VIGAARFADDVFRTGADDAIRGADDVVRGGDNVFVPRPPPVSFGEGASSVGASIDNGAATLERDLDAFPEAAESAARSMACDTIYAILDQGFAPDSEQWVVIVESAFLEGLGIEPPPGSAQWRGLEQIKDSTADAIIDPSTGEVDEPAADDLLNDLVCAVA